MSKRRDLFLENTSPYGFKPELLVNADEEMIRFRSPNATGYQVNWYGEDMVFFRPHFYRGEEKLPFLTSYEALLRSVPSLDHIVIDSIDTHALEQKMAAVDWFTAGPHYERLTEDALRQLHEIWPVMEQLKKTGNRAAANIVQDLQMKYWADSGAEYYTRLDMRTDRYDRSYEFYVRQQHAGINIRQAYNLLCGRPLLRTEGSDNGMPYWLQLKPLMIPKSYEQFQEHRYPDFDLAEKLSILPLKELRTEAEATALISGLQAGDKVEAEIESTEGVIAVKLTVDPEAQAVSIQQQGSAPEIIRAIDDFNRLKYNKPLTQSPAHRSKPAKKRKRQGL
ncbi:hypothetical protein [Pedobacter steynii]|uniref:Uncharacterized protein n=1 Tax=Pedobacter steynii TaxID=430522 RepID=A0A1D7QN69_9SPHI|nr:hypothetical protein [Pedobacter steynii]AOM80079.1 hypothetical protein BFS30_24700 [Pedobacter steynii]